MVLNFLLGSLAMVFTALWTDTLPYNVYMVFREVSALLYCFGGNNWQKCGWWCEYVCIAMVCWKWCVTSSKITLLRLIMRSAERLWSLLHTIVADAFSVV